MRPLSPIPSAPSLLSVAFVEMHSQSFALCLALVVGGHALKCPPGDTLTVTASDDDESRVLLSNGYVCVQVAMGGIEAAWADATGSGSF